jgi:hypothetical protein
MIRKNNSTGKLRLNFAISVMVMLIVFASCKKNNDIVIKEQSTAKAAISEKKDTSKTVAKDSIIAKKVKKTDYC